MHIESIFAVGPTFGMSSVSVRVAPSPFFDGCQLSVTVSFLLQTSSLLAAHNELASMCKLENSKWNACKQRNHNNPELCVPEAQDIQSCRTSTLVVLSLFSSSTSNLISARHMLSFYSRLGIAKKFTRLFPQASVHQEYCRARVRFLREVHGKVTLCCLLSLFKL